MDFLKEKAPYKSQGKHINIAYLGRALVEDTPTSAPPGMNNLISLINISKTEELKIFNISKIPSLKCVF
jgi:hypothetical protein